MHRIIRYISFLTILLLSIGQLSAQINIVINPVNPLQPKVSDLFKGNLSNTGSKTEKLYLVGTISLCTVRMPGLLTGLQPLPG